MTTPTVSIVVASVDRPDALDLCLSALGRLIGPSFEVIVVTGTTETATLEVARSHRSVASIVCNDDRNLSRSRNLGADQARGALVAFIDDDAYPSERWLADLVPSFDDPELGATGGETFDYTGVTLQARYSRCARSGDAMPVLCRPIRGLTETPAASTFDYPIGTNLMVRTEALRQVGGFDEQYDYYHDETDLARRLLDAGWIVRVQPAAHVFHKFLPSSIRGVQRIATNRRSILINRAYFAVRHQLDDEGSTAVEEGFERFVAQNRHEIETAIADGLADPAVLATLEVDIADATALLQHWLVEPPSMHRHLVDPASVVHASGEVVERDPNPVLHIAVEGDDERSGALAHDLAHDGHIVRLLSPAAGHSTVDLEDGIWQHRIHVPDRRENPAIKFAAEVARIEEQLWALDAVVQAERSPRISLSSGTMLSLESLDDADLVGSFSDALAHSTRPSV